MDSSDWPTWKTRFRCALNKLPDIQELKNYGKLDGPEPFRAYRLLSKHGKYNQSLIYSYLGLEQRPPGYKPRDKSPLTKRLIITITIIIGLVQEYIIILHKF